MGQPAAADLAARCGPIELLVVDVDGVLTDGVIAIDDRGVETEAFPRPRRQRAIASGTKAGKRAAILSGRRAAVGRPPGGRAGDRAGDPGARRQGGAVPGPARRAGLDARQVCYVGDDLADLPVLRAAGLAACPADAAAEVRDAAHLVDPARRRPGRGPRGRRGDPQAPGGLGRAVARYRIPA